MQLEGEVLVVEDQPGLLSLYELMLESSGLTVRAAGDGPSALELFTRHQDEIDLVIMDCQLHEISGVDVYREMLEIREGMKAVFCSGVPEHSLFAELEPHWHVKLLPKPFTTKELLTVVADMLKREH